MALTIRETSANDATQWLDLLRCALGDDFPSSKVYDLEWIKSQLQSANECQTWVAEQDGKLQAAISILGQFRGNGNPVTNLGRNLFRPESLNNGAAEALLKKIEQISAEEHHLTVVRILASDNAQQILFEKMGYTCIGFQPFKHLHRAREGVLFYVRFTGDVLATRLPISESLAQISELSEAVLGRLQITNPVTVRDGVTGYPLKTEVSVHEATSDDFELWRLQAESSNPSPEISGSFNRGFGYLRIDSNVQLRAIIGQREDKVVAGLAFYYDELDRCVRVTDSFSTDDLSMGAMLHHLVKMAQDQMSAVYVEVDVLISAPRLLKSAEQLGFAPIAYLPAFYSRNDKYTDVVKLVKLNMGYALENTSLTTHAQGVVKIVDNNFQDQKIGVAIINLLRGLPIFEGLGDGELRKIARLFTQKLYRPNERVFSKGDSGKEAYIVMRGQIDIVLEENSAPIASVTSGQIFGELAFLDGTARGAHAVASQASILLVIQRTAFNELVQREPHLGMVVMRNVAMDLSNKLRRANSALSPRK